MSIANPVTANWMYDFGDLTNTTLTAQSAPSINTVLANAKTTAQSMISSGAYGSTTAMYRIIVRADATVPQGYTIEVRLSPAT